MRLYPNIFFKIIPVAFSDASVNRASTPSTDLNNSGTEKRKCPQTDENTYESTLHIDESISRALDFDVASNCETDFFQCTPNNHTYASTKNFDQHIQKNHTYVSSSLNTEIYSTTKETHQSLLGPIMEIRIKK